MRNMQFWICIIETVTHPIETWNRSQRLVEIFRSKKAKRWGKFSIMWNHPRKNMSKVSSIWSYLQPKLCMELSWWPGGHLHGSVSEDSQASILVAFEYVAGILAGLLVCIVVRLYKYLKCFMSSRLITSSRHATRQVGLHIILASWILVSLRLVYHSHLANHYEHASIHAVGERNGLTVATTQNILVCACYEESPFLKS